MALQGKLPHPKRYITSRNAQGRAVIDQTFPPEAPFYELRSGDAAFAQCYVTESYPPQLADGADLKAYGGFLEQPPGLTVSTGTVLRYVDMPPGLESPMHQTVSMDYGVVLEGEVELVLDSGETRRLTRGDICVQRATMHAWRNMSSTDWARMLYILQPVHKFSVNGEEIKEDYGGMPGVGRPRLLHWDPVVEESRDLLVSGQVGARIGYSPRDVGSARYPCKTAVTGKAQLKQIHDALSENDAAIRQAMLEDTSYRHVEVDLEYWLALECLAKHFDAIDPESALRIEYTIARGEDLVDGTEPVGVVVLETATHCFLYCLMSALAPAISTGNAVIVQVSTDKSMLKTPQIVLRLIGDALDKDIFQTVDHEAKSSDLGCRHIRVLQNGGKNPSLPGTLLSNTEARVLAIVERDADIAAAVDALAVACFSLRGRSPYAPDLVLVNEQVKKEFLIAASRAAIELVADHTELQGKLARHESKSDMIRRVDEEGLATMVSTNPSAMILDIHDQ
ncbi:hypothetical protein NUW58_g484 [Xylaria curta]|uniref:Uncharacterized protein n=1 Tax=Xylaria curta TaxID=42375 RepID=A0ACC1PQG0_9PEZI|nr:hypothetical protein NUW58_g484 [Xylaria curta]